jgi:tRNA pseudouridine38-40 synthase
MDQFNYKIIISYDGTHYSGWQIQPNGISIQQKVNEALTIFLRHPTYCMGSGRTDAGVHAIGQTAHFTSSEQIDFRRFLNSLNGLLPSDIRIKSIESVPLDFHARYTAKSKTYHYYLHTDPILNPFKKLYSLHVFEKFDSEAFKLAAKEFLGAHDFTAFANESHSGVAAHDPIRTIKRLDIIEVEGGLRLEIEADGFLYKMVRNITGTLLDVAKGKLSPDSINQIIASKDRKKAGKAAPAHGLFLYKVDY